MPRRLVIAGLLLAAAIAPALAAPAGSSAQEGLVARYRFEEIEGGVVKDESGRGNDLRAQGTVTLLPGKQGKAAYVSPAGYLQAPPSESLELGGAMTLEAWIRPNRTIDSGMRILDRQTIGGSDGFMLDTYPKGHLRLIIAPGQLRDENPLPVLEWTHVAVTYSDETGDAVLYRNGAPVAEATFSGKLKPSAHPLNVGASQGGGDRFDGAIDEVRIYARALSPEEIAAHFAGKEIDPPAGTRAGLDPLPVFTRGNTAHADVSALCARNDLVYFSPAAYPFEAMHLGNGNLCACLWNEGGLTLQVNNGSYRRGNEPVSSGKVVLSTPALSLARPARFSQRLRLWDGTVTTQVSDPAGAAEVTSFVTEGDDCVVLHCRETGKGPRTLSLHLWPSRTDAHFIAGPGFVALTEKAEHKEPYLATAMALLVRVEGARVTVGRKDERTLTLTFQDARSAGAAPAKTADYTVTIANPVLRGTEQEALAKAQAIAGRARAKGFAKLLAERKAFWHAFWPKSFLRLASRNGEAEFLENLWYLFFYDLASMSRHTLCPKFNGGNWLVYEDTRHWGGGYWHQNTREVFWPAYAAGHSELTDPFFELYGRAAMCARESGRVGLKTDGYYIPEWIPVNVGPSGPKDFSHPGYTAFVFTVGLEVALQGWWRYQFTGDERFLRQKVYPLLKGSLDFYLNYAKKGPDGKYHIEPADAQESYWLVKDPSQDLAALRWAIPVALQVSERLGLDAALRPRWQELLANLAPFPVDPERKIIREADLRPTDERHNSENVADYAIYPFGVFGIGLPEYELARNTFLNRPVPGMGNGWEPAGIAAARLGLADEAGKLVLSHMLHNFRSVNGGWYSPTTTVFAGGVPDSPYFDAPGVCAQALQEMLLQSQGDTIRLAPAWPAKWPAQYRLLARGGFVVTAEVYQGAARYALIESTRGGRCRVANPWPDAAVVSSGGKRLLSTTAPLLEFDTTAGKTYRLERASAPLAKMAYAPLRPESAGGARWIGKRLPPWPNWMSPAYLGIDAEGRTPQRAAMLRAVEGFRTRLAEATAGLADLSTGKAQVTITRGKDAPLPAPALTAGGPAPVDVPNQEYVLLDLGAERAVSAVAFSRDRTGLFVDAPATGCTIEGSADGKEWRMLADRAKAAAAPAGQVEAFPAAPARYVRLRLWGQYNGAVRLSGVAVYGK